MSKCVSFVVVLLIAASAMAVPQQINYQGSLTSPAGTALDTTVTMTFKLYTDSTAGSLLWTETRPSMIVTDGLFQVRLGQLTVLTDAILNQSQVWLGITVGADAEMTPRSRIVSVGYSYRVGTVDGASGGTIMSDVIINNKLNVGSGNSNEGIDAVVHGANNHARGDYSVVAGGGSSFPPDSNRATWTASGVTCGRRNSATNTDACVGGGFGNTNSGTQAFIGSGTNNTITITSSSCGILAGAANTVSANYAAICAGLTNAASGQSSFLGAGSDNIASGQYSFVGSGRYNRARGDKSVIVGGGAGTAADSNSATGDCSFIGGGSHNTAGGDSSVICGGKNNTANGPAAFAGGGGFNHANGFYSVVVGGGGFSAIDSNSASGAVATISGGYGNIASQEGNTVSGGGGNTASGNDYATVSGGYGNTSSNTYSTVSGGYTNTSSGGNSTVSGGGNNMASGSSATVSGGSNNVASNQYATIGGGRNNRVSGVYSVVAGGGSVTSPDSNSASGDYSFVGGGTNNTAGGDSSVVCGGADNSANGQAAFVGGGYSQNASGYCATIPGGYNNTASQRYSFAAGRNAAANDIGAFVWSDSTSSTIFSSPGVNTFNVRASGGTNIYSNSGLSSGVTLAAGGNAWAAVSDYRKKENFRDVNTRSVLDKVSALKISEWNYKSQDAKIRHMGPMAQDFYAQFGLGESDTTITTIDPDGVALAAIQELAKHVKELERENVELRTQMQSLMAEQRQSQR